MSILGGTLEQPLTQEEKKFYGQIFKTLDPTFTGSISGMVARPLLETSGLPLQTLGEIWLLADPNSTGSLDQFTFCVVMRLIAHLQNGSALDVNVANKVSPQLAKFSTIPIQQGVSRTSSINSAFNQQQTGSSSSPAPQISAVPPLLPPSVQSFGAMFDRSTATGKLSGSQAQTIFLNSKLPVNVLGLVWNLVDTTQAGELNKSQFVVAMHLLQCLLNKSLAAPPQSIPEYIWQASTTAVTKAPTQSSPLAQHVSPAPTGITSRVSSQASGSSVVLHTPPVTSDSWVITPQQKQSFDAIFDNLDKDKVGSISGGDVANFLVTSKLPNDVLATIWELSNLDGSDVFNKSEFAIAMFLVQKKVAGFNLPDETPASLISSVVPQQTQHYQQPAAPVRAPSSAQAPPVHQQPVKPKSAYDDLADLFSISAAPASPVTTTATGSAPIVPPVPASRQPISSTVTGTRAAFVPSSSFGQHMVQEQHQQPPTQNEQSLLADSDDDDDDEGPEDPTAPKFKHAPPAIPGRDHKPVFDSAENSTLSTPNATGSGPNYDALRSFPSQSSAIPPPTAAPAAASQFSSQPTGTRSATNEFSSQPAAFGEFSSQPTGGFSSQPTSGTVDGSREVTNKLSQATVDIANFSNQINSLTVQTTNVNAKRDKAQGELNKILKVKETIQQKLVQLRALYEREIQQVTEVESVLVSSKQESDKLQQELSLAEASYHAEQTKLQQLQLEFEESQKQNQTMKEKLGVLNVETSDLKDQLNNLTAKLKQSQNMVSVTTQQVAMINNENEDLSSRIGGIQAQIQDVVVKHQELIARQAQLEDKNVDLHNSYGSLSADYSEKSLDYSTALATGAALGTGLGVAAAAGLSSIKNNVATSSSTNNNSSSLPLEEGDVPTASLDDFDDFSQEEQVAHPTERSISVSEPEVPTFTTTSDTTESSELPTTPIGSHQSESVDVPREEPDQSTGSLTNTAVGSSTKQSTVTSISSPPTSDYQYPQTQQFPLPFARPQSATSSVQNNPPQSVRGDFESAPASPTSTIEEENIRGLSNGSTEEVLSSQILPEGQSEEQGQDHEVESQHDHQQFSSGGESFEIVNRDDIEEAQQAAAAAAAAAAVTVPAVAHSAHANAEEEENDNVPVTEAETLEGSDDLDPSSEQSKEEESKSADDLEPKPIPEFIGTEKVDESEKSPIEEESVEKSVEEPTSELIPVSMPGSFEPLEDETTEVATEPVEESKETSTPSVPTAKIDDEFPPIQELSVAEENSSDDEEFHDSYQNLPGQQQQQQVSSKSVSESEASKLPATNPFSFGLTPATLETGNPDFATGFSNAETTTGFSGFTSAPAASTTKNINMFDDLGLEEATAETTVDQDNFGDISGGAFTGFSGFPTAAVGDTTTHSVGVEDTTTATADDWEHVFAGFGNDPSLKEASNSAQPGNAFDAAPSYEEASFSNPAGFSSSVSGGFVAEKSKQVEDNTVGSHYSQSQELAIEEIEGMGFSRDEAIAALQKNNWGIDLATNYLLDSA